MIRSYFIITLAVFSLIGCGTNEVVNPELIIDKTKLQRLTDRYDTTFVLFWTDWCDSSKIECENKYVPLAELFNQRPHCNVILIAADANISESVILSHRSKGIHSYYLNNPGYFSVFNRLRIKSFLNYCFPDKQLSCTEGVFFETPVQLLLCKQKLEENPLHVKAQLALMN